MPEPLKVYWDANLILTWIEKHPVERLPVLDALIDAAATGKLRIYTSIMSMTEVAFGQHEKDRRSLDPDVEAAIDDLWQDYSVLTLVEYHQIIARNARQLIRHVAGEGLSLKPADAIHLATAEHLGVAEFHSYDTKLRHRARDLGLPFPVIEPRADQPKLFVLP